MIFTFLQSKSNGKLIVLAILSKCDNGYYIFLFLGSDSIKQRVVYYFFVLIIFSFLNYFCGLVWFLSSLVQVSNGIA
jgi:hypothetical protein